MRNMSFSLTTEAVRRREKTVTRRLGWKNLKPGTYLQAVEQAQGLKKGEHVVPICKIRVVSVTPERLGDILAYFLPMYELRKEGFPNTTLAEFITMFMDANHCTTDTMVNRIEFEYA
jgi:hypothetical protein